MWLTLIQRLRFFNSELGNRNTEFLNRVRSHQKKFKLHEKTMNIQQSDINKWTSSHSKKQLADKIHRESNYDFDVQAYIKKFNSDHDGKINLLDFSNYATKFSDFKQNAVSKKDMQVIREFQKRKIDQRLHNLQKPEKGYPISKNQNPLDYQGDLTDGEKFRQKKRFRPTFTNQPEPRKALDIKTKGWFDLKDDFVMILLERSISTKITTLNRINFYRTLLFMGNGNGIISYGKSRDLSPEGSMNKAIIQCKKNLIAIPLDQTCTLPRGIKSRFQDFTVYLRPCAGFNSWGNPMFSAMLALSGISHAAFTTVHTGKNNYTLLHSFFKAVTQNTTPQDMAEKEGFKVYRHRFIRPLTQKQTNKNHLSY